MRHFSQSQSSIMRQAGHSAGRRSGKTFRERRWPGGKASLFLPMLLLTSALTARQGRAQTAVSAPPASRSVQTAPTIPPAVSLPAPAAFDYAEDARLVQKISLQCKSVSFSELCRRMQAATGIAFTASPLTADDNITLFCHERPLADILPQIERLFSFTWQRTGGKAAYRYDLTQTPLQVAQERTARELDKLSGLTALDRSMELYRPLLTMTPEQLQKERGRITTPRGVDVRYFLYNSTPTLYLSLSSSEKAEMVRGVPLTFTASAGNMGRVPAESFRRHLKFQAAQMIDHHVFVNGVEQPQPPHPTEAQVLGAADTTLRITMQLRRDKGGRYSLDVSGMLFIPSLNYMQPVEEGYFPIYTVARDDVNNRRLNAALVGDAAMRRTVALNIKPTYAKPISVPRSIPMPDAPALICADYEEAVFNAAGNDVIGDGFAELCPLKLMKTQEQPLFDALCFNSDWMHLRWAREMGWLTFRTPDYFNKRALQIPSRTLERWAASRREHGAATLDDLAEMAQTVQALGMSPDIHTDIPEQSSEEMAALQDISRQACACYGLMEWDLAHGPSLQMHCHFLGKLSPELRQLAASPRGLSFARLPQNLRAEFTRLGCGSLAQRHQMGLPDLIDSTLRVVYKPMSRMKNPLLPSDGSDAAEGIGHLWNDDGTTTLIAVTPRPPDLNPDWDLQFIYTFGSKRTGKFRRTISTNGFSLSDPGEIKD